MKSKDKKRIRPRHRIVSTIVYGFMRPYTFFKYGARLKRLDRKAGKKQYLVLYNHQTAFDQFFVGMLFRKPLYYVASEDIFSNGFVSSLIKYLVAPIPIKKQTTDVRAVIECIKTAKEGGSIAIAPEGNRTYAGEPVNMNSAIAALAKKLALPIAFVKIEGGYGTHPRWSDTVRKGGMTVSVDSILEPEEYKDLSDAELMEHIKKALYVNEYSQNRLYKHKKKAEHLERAMYVCPWCGLSEFESRGNVIACKRCGRGAEYGEDLLLRGTNCKFPFKTTAEWYNYQCDAVRALDLSLYSEKELYCDTVSLREVVVYKEKRLLGEGIKIKLFGDRIELERPVGDFSSVISFDEASALAVLGRNKVNIYVGKKILQLKGEPEFNGLKYVNIYYRYRSMKGDSNGEFLGL